MKFLPVLKWMINITLFVAVVASCAGMYFWNRSDELIQKEILKRFSEAAPDLQLIVGATSLQGTHGVTLKDVEIREAHSGKPLLRAEELHVLIDSARLVERQQIVVNKVLLKSAAVLVSREADGRWNWQNYAFNRPETSVAGLPQIVVEDLRVHLTLKHGSGIPPATLLLSSPQFLAVPTSQHAYEFDGGISLPGVGLLNLSGVGDLASKQWQIGGRLRDVKADHNLMQIAQATSPQLEGQLSQLDEAMGRLVPNTNKLQSGSTGAALIIGKDSNIAPQFLGVLDVNFDAFSVKDSPIPEFKLRVQIKDGRLVSPALPMALTDVNGVFYKDNANLIFRLDEARGGDAKLTGGFQSETGPDAEPGKAWLKVERFPISPRLGPLLPERLARLFDAFRPNGFVSASGEWDQQANGVWRAGNLNATIHEGSVLYHKFKYPTSGLAGTITQRATGSSPSAATDPSFTDEDVLLDVDVRGNVGERPCHITGWMKNPGPSTEMRIQMGLTEFPIDSRFRNALEEKQQSVIDSLHLSGMANANLMFYRPPGLDQPTHMVVDARVYNGRMNFVKFPYGIDSLSGHLTFDSSSRHWEFLELNGRHGTGMLAATGSFRGDPSPGVLGLTITAKNAALEPDLYNALSRPQRNLWNMIQPDGFCDLTAKIDWTAVPGLPAIVHFPAETPVRIFNAKIRPKPFPYDMIVQEALISFDPNDARFAGVQHCEIHSFEATHNESPINATGWAEAKSNGEWQVHLDDLTAGNLRPDEELRAAMPATWRSTMERMHHAGVVSIENSQMDFRGSIAGDRNTTARWDLNMRFLDCAMNAGLDVNHIYGLITAAGTWDGFQLQNNGNIQLETAEVLEMPFTGVRGPYSLNNVELVMGSRQVFEGVELNKVDSNSRVKAQAYGGELFLDAHVDLREGGRYQFYTELVNARLEAYAASNIPDQRNLKGVVTAWMRLSGAGDDSSSLNGKGQLRISPAALYELPVMVKLLGSLSQLNFNVQNLTAFDYAMMDFAVHDDAFWLNPVDLVGEAISFRGQGSIGFTGAVNLDFYSRPARTRTVAIPLLSGLFTNWSKVEIRGTTSSPQTRAAALGQIDEGMKQFLQAFNPNPNGQVPMLTAPRFFQRTASPAVPRFRQQANGPAQRPPK